MSFNRHIAIYPAPRGLLQRLGFNHNYRCWCWCWCSPAGVVQQLGPLRAADVLALVRSRWPMHEVAVVSRPANRGVR